MNSHFKSGALLIAASVISWFLTVGGVIAWEYDGEWTGETETGRPVGFLVTRNEVRDFKIEVDFSDAGSSCVNPLSFDSGDTAVSTVESGAFERFGEDTGGGFHIYGSFSDGTDCVGTFQLSINSGPCAGSGTVNWSALMSSNGAIPENGIWKSAEGDLNLFVQKYEIGSCVVIVTFESRLWAFLDDDYRDGIVVHGDLTSGEDSISLELEDSSNGTVSLNSEGRLITKSVTLKFFDDDESETGLPDNGIWIGTGRDSKVFLQKYTTGSCALVLADNGVLTAFLAEKCKGSTQIDDDIFGTENPILMTIYNGSSGTLGYQVGSEDVSIPIKLMYDDQAY